MPSFKARMKLRRFRQVVWMLVCVGIASLSASILLVTVFRSRVASDVRDGTTSVSVTNGIDNWKAANSTWIILEAEESYQDDSLWHRAMTSTDWNVVVIQRNGVARCSQPTLCLRLEAFKTRMKDRLESFVSTMIDGTDKTLVTSSTTSTATTWRLASILLAATSGAQWIYVGQTGSLPISRLPGLIAGGKRTGLTYANTGHFDPIRTHYVHTKPRAGRYNLNVVRPPGLVAFWHHCTTQNLCSSANPPLYVKPGTLTSLPPSMSLLSQRNSLWALLLAVYPDNHPGRSLIASFVQRLLWETNQSLAIASSAHTDDEIVTFCARHQCPPTIVTKTSPHFDTPKGGTDCSSVVHNIPDTREAKGYNFRLFNVNCTWTDSPFVTCARELMTSYFDNWKEDANLQTISDWFRLLRDMRYRFPDRDPFTDWKMASHQKGVPVWFTPSPCRPSDRIEEGHEKFARGGDDVNTDDKPLTSHPWRLVEECRIVNVSIAPEIPRHFKIADILLIIVFNFPYLASHVPLLMTMYGRHFRHVLFCGENFPSFVKFYKMDIYPHVSFVEINHSRGTWGYSCMSAAIKMNYDVTGYLQMSDDVLLNVWSLKNVPRDKFWYQSRVRVADIRLARLPDIATTNRWYPWIFQVGRYAAIVAYRNLKQLLRQREYRQRAERFLIQLRKTTQCKTCLVYEASDIFYVPREFSKDFALFVDLFQSSQLHLEIAIPSAIFGLSPESDVFRLRGNYVWGDDRADFGKYYSPFDHYQHAWKLTRLSSKEGVNFFCQNYLPYLEKDLTDSSIHELGT